MKKVLDVLDRLFHYLAAIGFGCVTVCVLVQILARYIPGVTAPWTDEMTRLFFQYTIMIACPMAIKYHEYASIDVIAAQTHGTGRHILNLVSDAAILIVCLFGIPQARTYFRVGTKSLSTSLQINLGIFYVVPLVIFMKAIVVNGPGDMQLVERPMPEIKEPNQVLVKVHAAGICGSDVHVYHGSNPYAKYPVVLGHEGSGEVIAVGEGVTDLKPGASVVFEPITYCGKCYACRCGHHNVCRELKVLGCIVDGIFQEYVVMPRSQVYEYDASKMTYQQAALCEPFTIGLQANWCGDVRPGDVVLVHGGGPIGLIVANIAKSRGATVIVSEPNESRLAMAKDFGADYSINPMKEDLDAFINKLTDGEGVNVIFEAAGVPALLAHATSQLSPAGRLVAMTFGKEPIPVNFKEINAKELTILGTRHQYQKFPEVVKILPDHLKEVDEITTHVFKAEDFQKAFDTLADRNSGAGKVVLTFA